jgi:hypothetical protein
MKTKWLICNLGTPEKIDRLAYAIRETGRDASVVSLREIAEMYEQVDDTPECIVTMGSIWMNKALREVRPNWFGNFHNEKTFSCSTYYSHLGKYITQREYAMMPLSEVIRRREWLYRIFGGIDDTIFVRPDSGEKQFNGELVHSDRFQAWSEDVFFNKELDSGLMCVVAKPVQILKEIRLVIAGGKVVAGSTYRIARHLASEEMHLQEDMDRVIEYAEEVISIPSLPFPPVYVLDVAVEPDNMSVLEVGCFCCCGLYECDRHAVAVGVSEAVEAAHARFTESQLKADITV